MSSIFSFEEWSLVLLPIFWLGCFFVVIVESVTSAVCIFWKLSPCWLANISLHSMSCLFIYLFLVCLSIFFMVSFAVQKVVNVIRFICYFCFYFYFLGDWSKKTLVQFMSENVFPMISSRSFMVFKSLSHFEFFCVYGERVCSDFIDLYAAAEHTFC